MTLLWVYYQSCPVLPLTIYYLFKYNQKKIIFLVNNQKNTVNNNHLFLPIKSNPPLIDNQSTKNSSATINAAPSKPSILGRTEKLQFASCSIKPKLRRRSDKFQFAGKYSHWPKRKTQLLCNIPSGYVSERA